MTAGRAVAASLGLMLAALVAGCGFVPGVGNDRLHLLNGTTIPVQLAVEGRVIAVVNAGANIDLGPADLGAMPWRVEVRTGSGRALLTLDVEPGSVHDDPNLDGTGSYSAPAAGIDLSCGEITLYVGRLNAWWRGSRAGRPGRLRCLTRSIRAPAARPDLSA